ncbi:hypothetical protein KIN20_015054 [Parelaphostrongylus tenuis]|uniref:Uncharacterized protein n=1 Tax=Parelaphostrongylus tenuis TaxID=148309 RepID=A0AAD5MFK5_PARTN|nr:hypothetical protein KIN20_015054 [Parelaphostrongylus tenuis]
MKVLKFSEEKKDDEAISAELLDRLLLVIGLIGEMIFRVVGSKLVLNEDDHLMMRFKPGKQIFSLYCQNSRYNGQQRGVASETSSSFSYPTK